MSGRISLGRLQKESGTDLRSVPVVRIEEESDAGAWSLGDLPWARIGQAALLMLVLVAGGFFFQSRSNSDLDRFSRDELESVSPYLESGRRNGQGLGPAFIGTIDEAWLSLPRSDREASAAGLVLRLRDLGIEQVMIYDEDRALRIQALGSQPIRTL